MKNPTPLSTGQALLVRGLDASRRLVLGHVQEAVMRCNEGRAALAAGRRSALAGGIRDEGAIAAAFGEIEAALARAVEGLAFQAAHVDEARKMVGLDTPENIATAKGRGEGGDAGRAEQQRISAENKKAIREIWPSIAGTSTSQRAKGVKMHFRKKAAEFQKKAKEADEGGNSVEADVNKGHAEVAKRISDLSVRTIEKAVAPPRKAGSRKKSRAAQIVRNPLSGRRNSTLR